MKGDEHVGPGRTMRHGGRARWLAAYLASFAALAACNALSGVGDLQEVDGIDAAPAGDTGTAAGPDASTRDASVEAVAPPDAALGDALADAACGPLEAPVLLGAAHDAGGYYELTKPAVGVAGGVAWSTPASFAAFDVSFELAIEAPAAGEVAAGLALFVVGAPAKTLGCNSGASLCVLGGAAGYAVVLRTGRANNKESAVPYLAVVDAPTFPTSPPAAPLLLDAAAFETVAPGGGVGAPTAWHTISIHVAKGLVDVDIDGHAQLRGVAVPAAAAGTVGAWGIGAATGQAAGLELTAVRSVTLRPCP
jgi:hypothetical protein